ncbi:hypothetical protein ACH5RR_015702 [Cinchona calisaya]|uniref:Uncharacterized protein n=1 Tax=Cinchona calisaya TaxID=153742 RepID=A0ABD2ZU95_9GENT
MEIFDGLVDGYSSVARDLKRDEVKPFLARSIDNPLKINSSTADGSRLGKARICMEIDLTKPRLGRVHIENGKIDVDTNKTLNGSTQSLSKNMTSNSIVTISASEQPGPLQNEPILDQLIKHVEMEKMVPPKNQSLSSIPVSVAQKIGKDAFVDIEIP